MTFSNVLIQILNKDKSKKLSFICESARFYIFEDKLKDMILLESNDSNLKDSSCLFLSYESIANIALTRFKTVLNLSEFDEQLKDFNILSLEDWEGFVIPLKHLSQADFYCSNNSMFECLNTNKKVANEIINLWHVSWEIESLNVLANFMHLFPTNYNRIEYSLREFSKDLSELMPSSELMSDLDLNKFSFSSIKIDDELSSEELNLIWKLISSRRTRFSITYISIKLSKISEWLSVLALCTDCIELQTISLKYFVKDVKYDAKEVEIEFRKKFGVILKLEILKSSY